MMNIRRFGLTLLSSVVTCALVITPLTVSAWNSKDGTLEIHGFLDNTYHNRDDYGITKERIRGQIEWSKVFKPTGIFSELSFHGTLRATYDGVYDLNDDRFGDRSGGQAYGSSSGIPIGHANGRLLPIIMLFQAVVVLGLTLLPIPMKA